MKKIFFLLFIFVFLVLPLFWASASMRSRVKLWFGIPPTAQISLENPQNGSQISSWPQNTFFDIDVSGSSAVSGIATVSFSSDNILNGSADGAWTSSFNWAVSSGPWDTQNKVMDWSIANTGSYEVFAKIADNLGQNSSAFAVISIINQPPNKPSTLGTTWNLCAVQGAAIPIFSWTYSDPTGDPQAGYEIEVDDNASFQVPKFNHLVNLPSTSYALDLSQDDDPPDPGGDWLSSLAWNATYFWRVRVKDNTGAWSDWSNSLEFKTDKHASPWVVLSFTPAEPTQNETVEFSSSGTEVFGGASIASYLWTITQGTGNFVDNTTANDANPHIKFSTLDNKVKLQITDTDGYSCSKEKDVALQMPLPEYKEIPPIIWLKKILVSLVWFF